MKRKIILSILLAAALTLNLAACGAKPAGENSVQPAPQPVETTETAETVPEAAEPAPAEQIDYLTIYAPVLDETCDVLYNGYDWEEEYQYVSTGVIEAGNTGAPEEVLGLLGYAIEDVSGDGIPELLIGTVSESEQANFFRDVIFAGYTCKDGEIVMFLEGWARNSYQWLGGGRFFNSGSGGAIYSCFGTFHISEDGTELICEDFYFTNEKDASFTEIGMYHNTTGAWDVSVSEELELSDEAFWDMEASLEDTRERMELTPFADYDYTGFIAQPLDCKVRADYYDDVADSISFYDDAAKMFGLSAENCETTVVFQSKEGVGDFKLLALTLRDVDESGKALFDVSEVFAMTELRAGSPLAVPMSFPGDIPSSGFSYTDTDGTIRTYTLSVSGKDGSLVVAPLDSAGQEP